MIPCHLSKTISQYNMSIFSVIVGSMHFAIVCLLTNDTLDAIKNNLYSDQIFHAQCKQVARFNF